MSDNQTVTEREAEIVPGVPHVAPKHPQTEAAPKWAKNYMSNPTEEVTE